METGGFQVDGVVTDKLKPLLARSADDGRPVVLMTCGISGSGKSTLAKAIVEHMPQFTRLSIDEIIFSKHGLYGIEYPADVQLYQQYQDEADEIYLETFKNLLMEKQDVVLDRAFYAKEDRKEFKRMIEAAGGRRVLVYLKAGDKEALWTRIAKRSAKQKNANSALDIPRGTFEMFWGSFEEPVEEGEVVFNV